MKTNTKGQYKVQAIYPNFQHVTINGLSLVAAILLTSKYRGAEYVGVIRPNGSEACGRDKYGAFFSRSYRLPLPK